VLGEGLRAHTFDATAKTRRTFERALFHIPGDSPITTAMPDPTPELRTLLAEQAERVLHDLDATCAAISWWDHEGGALRTLVNVGELSAEEEAFPEEELYPLDAFPAIDALLRFGRPYLDPEDVASSAVLAHMRFGSQAAVPLVVDGLVWGEVWIAAGLGGRALTAEDVVALAHGAEAAARLLAARDDG
jgi:GAF domain-containing protein